MTGDESPMWLSVRSMHE